MSLAELASQHGLHKVGGRPPLGAYLAQTWQRRDFAYEMARSRVQAADENNRLGMLWMVLRPSLNAVVYGAIFGLLQGDNRPPDYPAYVVIGVFLFEFFSQSMSKGARSITGNRALVQSLAFPRITLPIAVVIEQFMTLLPMLAVMAVALIALGHQPTWEWLEMIPLLGLFALFNAGVAMIAARLTVHVRDLTQLIPFVTRILFYTSGVLFSVDKIFKDHPWAIQLYDFHPIYQVLQIARGALMRGGAYPVAYWGWLAVWSIVTAVLGVVFFWVAEERYGRE